MNILTFIDELVKLLESLSHANLIVLGDFNIDILQSNSVVDKFLVLLSDNGLDTLATEPTRITDVSSTCIDNVFCRLDNRFLNLVSCKVLNLKISDHCLIETKISGLTVLGNTFKAIETSYIDYDKLQNILLFEDWKPVYDCLDASEAFDKFMIIFSNHLVNCTSVKSSSKSVAKLKAWMTDNLLNLIRKRNKICNKAKKHPDNNRLKNYSLKLCNIVCSKVSLTKKQYFTMKFQQNRNNARKNWQTINEIIVGHREFAEINNITNSDGCTITGIDEIANEFNKYFTTVGGSNCSKESMDSELKARLISENCNVTKSFYYSEITSSELYFIINSLINKSSPGIDGFRNSVIKRMACFLTDVLAYIFNLSVNSGVFPLSLKRAVVIPVFKNNDRKCLNNYRPISLLPVISKIFEKAMKLRIVSFLDFNKFFSPQQYGFRQHRNTEKAIFLILR